MDKRNDADIVAQIHLVPTEAGGRKFPIPLGIFKCIFVYEGENFDCAIFTDQDQIFPGSSAKVPIKFLFPQNLKSNLKVGSRFTLRELHQIATGEVIEIQKLNGI